MTTPKVTETKSKGIGPQHFVNLVTPKSLSKPKTVGVLLPAIAPDKKDTNPKDAVGIKKVPVSTLPSAPLCELGLAMAEGARKYGRHNYRVVGIRASVYNDAIWRHRTQWWEGEDIDKDSGIHHLTKIAACALVARDAMFMEKFTDDRPPQYPNGLRMKKFNQKMADLIAMYPDCVPAYTELNKKEKR